MADKLWVDNRHPSYVENKKRRAFSRDHYTGEALTKARSSAKIQAPRRSNSQILKSADGVRIFEEGMPFRDGYLIQRTQGEADAAFAERAAITKFPGHMATLVESFVGGVFAVESNAERTIGDPLGDPKDEKSVMYGLWRDIDGSGQNWLARLIADAARLIYEGEVWHLADRTAPDEPIRIYRLDPDSIVHWRYKDGVLVEVLTRNEEIRQGSLKEEPEKIVVYTHYTVDGWSKYVEVREKDGSRSLTRAGTGEWDFPFYAEPERLRRRVPISRMQIPMGREIGYQMALDANALWNLYSDGRWLIRVINHPRLAGNVDDSAWNKSLEAMRMGVNALQGDWDFIHPSAENARAAFAMYVEEVREFYIQNHQRANQSAIERSATEVLFNEAAGRTAFLSLLAQSVDEVENDWLFLAAQLEAPTRPDEWRASSVKRAQDFKPIDIEGIADKQANRFAALANHLPAPLAAKMAGYSEDLVSEIKRITPDIEDDDRGSEDPFMGGTGAPEGVSDPVDGQGSDGALAA